MRELPYKIGINVIRFLQKFGFVEDLVSPLAKAWTRQSKFRTLLNTFPFDEFIDCGANIGEFSLCAKSSHPEMPILCVEPHPQCAEKLRRLGFAVIQKALWSHGGKLSFYSDPVSSAISTVVATSSKPNQIEFTVDAIPLSELPVSGDAVILKLDLQGADWIVLESVQSHINRFTCIIVEVSYGLKGTYSPISGFLSQNGYIEYSTLNELESDGYVVEADKIWIKYEFYRDHFGGNSKSKH